MSHTDDFLDELSRQYPDHISAFKEQTLNNLKAALVCAGLRGNVLLLEPKPPSPDLGMKMIHAGKTLDFMVVDDPLEGITEKLLQVCTDKVLLNEPILLNHPCKAPMDLIVTAGCTTPEIPFFDGKQVKKYGRQPFEKFIARGHRKKRFS